ncbi:MAG TPA: hypothetical protein VGF98_07705 [Candidatus Tumulicola sp.]|jgi:hypothetical protein
MVKFVSRHVFALSSLAILSACSGDGTAPAADTANAFPTTARGGIAISAHTNHGHSWMNPVAKSGALVYITDNGAGTVVVYSYPALNVVGTLAGFDNVQGDCVDASGNVWIDNTQASQLLEYAHGGTSPIATLSDPGQYPVGCSVDPTTGDLAVSNFYSTNGPPGSISIYKNATGTPATFTPPNFAVVYYLGYDKHGTLYLDGIDSGSAFLFASFNGKKFKAITLQQPIGGPGAVQAVGDSIVVGDQTNGNNAAYAFTIAGSTGKLVKTTPLTGANDIVQFNIYKNALVGGDLNFNGSTADRFKYPAGGAPKKTAAGLSAPIGAVISP